MQPGIFVTKYSGLNFQLSITECHAINLKDMNITTVWCEAMKRETTEEEQTRPRCEQGSCETELFLLLMSC